MSWTPPRVGDTAEMSRTITADDIALFSRISGDHNPLHYDEEAARRAGQRLASTAATVSIDAAPSITAASPWTAMRVG